MRTAILRSLVYLGPEGASKTLNPAKFTANCLCVKHNSALSPLDDAARYFFAALQSCLHREKHGAHFIISGHDLERWLLKTAKAMAVSKNFGQGNVALTGAFSNDVQVLEMLDDPSLWPPGAGLYGINKPNTLIQNQGRFQLQPLTDEVGGINGLVISIVGLAFILLLKPVNLTPYPEYHGAKFRPSEMVVTYPQGRDVISISWDDGKPHPDFITLQFVSEVP